MNSRNIKLMFIFVELMTIGLFLNIHNFCGLVVIEYAKIFFIIKHQFSAILKIKYYFGMLWVQRKKRNQRQENLLDVVVVIIVRQEKKSQKNDMNDKEKIEAIQQILVEISSKQRNYLDDTSLLDYFERQIKKILEE